MLLAPQFCLPSAGIALVYFAVIEKKKKTKKKNQKEKKRKKKRERERKCGL